MLVRAAFIAATLWFAFTGSVSAVSQGGEADQTANPQAASSQEAGSALQIEERTLADLATGMDAFVLSPSQDRQSIRFELPPHAVTTEAWLRLAARPASETTTGLIHVSLNGGEAITIRPQARPMEARFALFSGDLRTGENRLDIEFSSDTASAGWIVDARRSQLRLSLESTRELTSLDALERALAADFAGPRRVALMSEISRERATQESLVAQAIALRAGAVPIFGGEEDRADLIIRIAEIGRLSEADRAALRAPGHAQGPEIAMVAGDTPRLIITGRNIDEATAAARLFAARSFAGYETSFLASDAISAARLGERPARSGDRPFDSADLRSFAASGLPFSADQGARTAVLFTSRDAEDRFGALSVMARAALTSGQAWLFAWYGEAEAAAPNDHNLLVIGPGSTNFDAIDRSAPAELRAALRAAERSEGQRGLMRLAAAAYADSGESEEPASEADRREVSRVGVASLFEDRDQAGRWIATLTTPARSSFEMPGRSLARSDLWNALEGRAALWSTRGVTPLDFSVAAPTLVDRMKEVALDHTRDIAFILFGVGFVVLFRGMRRRRKNRHVHAS